MMPLLIYLLAGIALGQRLQVLSLVPAIPVALAVTVGTGLSAGHDFPSIALTATAVAIVLQVGYLLGVGLQAVTVAVAPVAPEAYPRFDPGLPPH
jgi:hypothetical protein